MPGYPPAVTNPPVLVIKAIAAVQRFLHKAVDSPLPPAIRLGFLAGGAANTGTVKAMAELGLADIMDGKRLTAAQIAEKAGTDPQTTHRFLLAATAIGLC